MKIGFIGLGIMGRPMAKNLVKAGYSLVVLDKNKASSDELIEMGAQGVATNLELAGQSEVIITMLPDSPEVQEVVLGEGGVIEGAKTGTTVIDMSSIAPLASREIYGVLKEKGIHFLDAPVSGGEGKAIDGSLAVMVGGDQEIFDQYYDLLMDMAGSVVHVGETGAGNVAKLCNQVIVALNISAVSEAMILAKKAGVDPERVCQAIRGGSAGSAVLEKKAPKIMDRNFQPGFKTDLHIKDLNNVMETAHGIGTPLPLTAQVMEIMQSIKADGRGGEDHTSIVKFYEKLSGVEVTRGIQQDDEPVSK